jgi:DNA-binding CsgD family transcriptional regulator
VTPLAVLALLRARRGDPGVTRALDEAMRLAAGTNEPQRLVPALMARGEVAWLRGDTAAAAGAFREARDLVAGGDSWAWSAAEAWLGRIGEPTPGAAGSAVGPYRLELAGEHTAAGIEWRRLGCPYEEALALTRADAEGQRRAVALLDGLSARVTLSLVARALRAAGARALPRGPRRGTRENPFGLTAREVDVCELLRRGLRNAEIATRLHLAPRTVEHHVAAILGKTGASTRTEAAAVYTRHVTAAEK